MSKVIGFFLVICLFAFISGEEVSEEEQAKRDKEWARWLEEKKKLQQENERRRKQKEKEEEEKERFRQMIERRERYKKNGW